MMMMRKSLLQVTLGLGVAGASWAYCSVMAGQVLLLAAYVLATGRAATTWGFPSHEALQVGPIQY